MDSDLSNELKKSVAPLVQNVSAMRKAMEKEFSFSPKVGIPKRRTVVIDAGLSDIRLVYNDPGECKIKCVSFQKEHEAEFFRYCSKFGSGWKKVLLEGNPFEKNNRLRAEIQRKLDARLHTSKTEELLLALKTLKTSCHQSEWIYFSAYIPEHHEYLTYPEFYEIGLEIFEGRQKMDDSELDKEPVVLSIFGEMNRNIYMDGENRAELMASGFNASYLLGMARVVADCKTPQQFAVAASLGTCTATSGCLSHFPARDQYAIFDTRTMKRLFDGRTTYVVWPFSRYDAEKPFTREDKARTVLRHSMDTFFFAALRQARYHQARNVFLAGELGDCMETVQHAVMTFFPMLDKFHKGERLNVFIIKPTSYLSAIGALISHDS